MVAKLCKWLMLFKHKELYKKSSYKMSNVWFEPDYEGLKQQVTEFKKILK